MTMTSKERAALRGEAHHLTAKVRVGQQGLTNTVLQTIDDTLRTHELVKIQLGKHADVKARDAASQLAAQMDAEVVQVIGKTVSLYRENPDLKRKQGGPPPWRE